MSAWYLNSIGILFIFFTEFSFSQNNELNYVITEDVHTKTGKPIWVAKPEKELSKSDFAETKRKLATIQGFYSTFKHGFIFNYNPEEALQTV